MTFKYFMPTDDPTFPSYYVTAVDCPECLSVTGQPCIVRDDNLVQVHKARVELSAVIAEMGKIVHEELGRVEEEERRERDRIVLRESQRQREIAFEVEQRKRKERIRLRRKEMTKAGRDPNVPLVNEPGMYRHPETGEIYEVRPTVNDRLVARVQRGDGKYRYVRGLIYELEPHWRVG